jgi:hypothetical protein
MKLPEPTQRIVIKFNIGGLILHFVEKLKLLLNSGVEGIADTLH